MTDAPVERLDIVWVELGLRQPWRSATGDLETRPTIIVAAHSGGATGWGECPALPDRGYDGEDLASCWAHLTESLGPRLVDRRGDASEGTPPPDRSHRLAHGAVHLARADLGARLAGRRLRDDPRLRVPPETVDVPAGVVVDDVGDPEQTVERVARYVEEGYGRVKLKIHPGHDLAWCRAVVAQWPRLCVGVDANGTYHAEQIAALRRLDDLGLAFIEQPLPADDLDGLAALAEAMDTPICLDESIRDRESLEAALGAGAADLVSLKWSRLGGLGPAADLASMAQEAGVGAFVGGMIESGVGRAAATLLAAHPAMTLPGDLSSHHRFFTDDIVTPAPTMTGGRLALPDGPGLGVEIDIDALDSRTRRSVTIGA